MIEILYYILVLNFAVLSCSISFYIAYITYLHITTNYHNLAKKTKVMRIGTTPTDLMIMVYEELSKIFEGSNDQALKVLLKFLKIKDLEVKLENHFHNCTNKNYKSAIAYLISIIIPLREFVSKSEKEITSFPELIKLFVDGSINELIREIDRCNMVDDDKPKSDSVNRELINNILENENDDDDSSDSNDIPPLCYVNAKKKGTK
jgi:hypothetical protein